MAYHFFIISLVSSLCITVSKSADVFISIDCGSSLPFKDRFGIGWLGDDKYVQSGQSTSVGLSNSIGHVADTLRVFTNRRKNCYNIDSVKKGRSLVRASFYYGNYDGKSSPPTFALQFDGNYWTQVRTSSTRYNYYEVTYVVKRDSISVCVAQANPGQFPFITALGVRSLEPSMYPHIDLGFPLFYWLRVSFGSNTSISFPEDPYDRIWGVGAFENDSIPVPSDAVFSKPTTLYDRPPAAVLKNAITAVNPNGSIELVMEFPSYEILVYINWYFSEVTRLELNQNRSFRIFKDNEAYSNPIVPPYAECDEMWVSEIKVSNKTTFSLVPTNVSTLPPLINAMEIFRIGEFQLTDGTNKKDVEGLASLQERFSALQSLRDDPCLPLPYTWDWIECNGDPTPRVTSLLLGHYSLSMLLPDFGPMDALQTIYFNRNSLFGPILNFLGTLPSLTTLNLANNKFNGSIPASLSGKTKLILTVAGNPELCISDSSCHILANSSIKKSKTKMKTKKNVMTDLE